MSKGIYPREKSILIYFTHNGQSYRETLTGVDGKPLPPTPKNVNYAAKVREQIMRAIATGTFKLDEFFPHSKTATATQAKKATVPVTVEKVAEAFLNAKARRLEATSFKSYQSSVRHLTKPFGARRIDSISYHELEQHFASLKLGPTTYNTALSIARSVFEYAIQIGVAASNPARLVSRVGKAKSGRDNLTPDEARRVVADMREHYDPQIANYFDLAFQLGFRPSEGIDLRWKNVNEARGTLLIESAKVWGKVKGTKTHKSRVVELDEPCLAILRAQKLITFGREHGRIFDNPNVERPWYKTAQLNSQYWLPSLRRCGIRERDSRQTRHTCASLMLMAGCRPEWSARQLGHSIKMFQEVYSDWISELDAGRERGKMTALFGGQSFTGTSLASASA